MKRPQWTTRLFFIFLNIQASFALKEYQEVKKYAEIPDGLLIETINNYDETGRTPLHHAARIGHLEALLNILKVGADINRLSLYANESALYLAAEGGHDVVVSALISRSADINMPNSHGVSPIYIASQSGHLKVVQHLLEAGAEVADVEGITPLMVAAIRGKSEIVKLLANSSRVDINRANKLGETALMLCTVSRDIRCVQYLLDFGADYNITDNKGYTVLTHAAIRNCAEILDLLISAGVDMESRDHAGLTSLQHAQVSTIENHGCMTQIPQERSNFEVMNVLLGRGAEIGSGFRYRIPQEVKRRRDETIIKNKENQKKMIELDERRRQNEVEVAIKERLDKNKITHDRSEL